MVSGVSDNMLNGRNVQGYTSEYSGYTNAIKNTTVVKNADEFDSFATVAAINVGLTGLTEGIPFALYLKRNKKLKGEMTPHMQRLSESTQTSWKNIFNERGSFIERAGKYLNVVNNNFNEYSKIRDIAKAKVNIPESWQSLSKTGAKAGNKPNFIESWFLKRKRKNLADKLKTASQEITPGVEEKLGFKKLMKLTGAKWQLGIFGAIELITEVIPTFLEYGSEKGMKQLGKSAIKTAAGTAGFIAGQQTGLAIGSAIGTALFPGAGTAIGGAIGFIAGGFGAYGADMIVEKILGKSEKELAKEEEQKNGHQLSLSA